MDNLKTIEKFILEDGRHAERHISTNEAGEKVIELFVEEKKPLILEKRVIEKRKEILAEQVIETVRDGQVIDVKVHSVDPNVKMELREHLGVAKDSELNALNYVSKKELGPVISQAVVAGVAALMNNNHNEVSAQSIIVTKAQQTQDAIENRVETKKKTDKLMYIIAGIIIVAEALVIGIVFM